MKHIIYILFLVCSSFLGHAQQYIFDFEDGFQDWSVGYSDYPVGEETFYELLSSHSELPTSIEGNRHGIMVSGNNHSDDLFMFLKKRIDGLTPYATYRLFYDVTFATNYGTQSFGIGGSPGTSVYMKAGAVQYEPMTIIDTEFLGYKGYIMNLDKANQANSGKDLFVIGDVAAEGDVVDYVMKTNRSEAGNASLVTADAEGAIWLCIGTDSGFEGTTRIYYDEIQIVLEQNTASERITDELVIYPNPSDGIFQIHTPDPVHHLRIYSGTGSLLQDIAHPDSDQRYQLPQGVYHLQVDHGEHQVTRHIVIK